MPPRSKSGRASQEVRIIGGIHKGRKLRFRGNADLRPTLGRTRETLFNWLRPSLAGAHCLDLFAGSGVLGFEALSQGATNITFVEKDRQAHAALMENIELLCEGAHSKTPTSSTLMLEGAAASPCSAWLGDARRFLKTHANGTDADAGYDVIFIDPPFRRDELLYEVLDAIAQTQIARRYVYVEARNTERIERTCGQYGLSVSRATRTGDAAAVLLECPTVVAGPAGNSLPSGSR